MIQGRKFVMDCGRRRAGPSRRLRPDFGACLVEAQSSEGTVRGAGEKLFGGFRKVVVRAHYGGHLGKVAE